MDAPLPSPSPLHRAFCPCVCVPISPHGPAGAGCTASGVACAPGADTARRAQDGEDSGAARAWVRRALRSSTAAWGRHLTLEAALLLRRPHCGTQASSFRAFVLKTAYISSLFSKLQRLLRAVTLKREPVSSKHPVRPRRACPWPSPCPVRRMECWPLAGWQTCSCRHSCFKDGP